MEKLNLTGRQLGHVDFAITQRLVQVLLIRFQTPVFHDGARHGHGPRAGDFNDPKRLHELDKGIDSRGLGSKLNDDGVVGDVNDVGLEVTGEVRDGLSLHRRG